jgi:hypothetical protein
MTSLEYDEVNDEVVVCRKSERGLLGRARLLYEL